MPCLGHNSCRCSYRLRMHFLPIRSYFLLLLPVSQYLTEHSRLQHIGLDVQQKNRVCKTLANMLQNVKERVPKITRIIQAMYVPIRFVVHFLTVTFCVFQTNNYFSRYVDSKSDCFFSKNSKFIYQQTVEQYHHGIRWNVVSHESTNFECI